MDANADKRRMFQPPSPASRRFTTPEPKRRFVSPESKCRAARQNELSDDDNDLAAALAQAEAAAKAEVEAVTQAAATSAIQSEVPEPRDTQKMYTCDYGCGFVGAFEGVALHEQECALNPDCQLCSTSPHTDRADAGNGTATNVSSSSKGVDMGEQENNPEIKSTGKSVGLESRAVKDVYQNAQKGRCKSENEDDDHDIIARFELLGRPQHQEVDAVEPEQESEHLKLSPGSNSKPKAVPDPVQTQTILEQVLEPKSNATAQVDGAATERSVHTISGLGLAPATEAHIAQLLQASKHKLKTQLQITAKHHAQTLAAVVRRCKRRADDATLRALADDRLAAIWRRAARLHSGQSLPLQPEPMSDPHQSFIDSGGLAVAVSRQIHKSRRGTQPHIRAMAARGVFEDAESDGADDESSSSAHSSDNDNQDASAARVFPSNTRSSQATSAAQSGTHTGDNMPITTARRRSTHVHIRTMAQKGFSDSDSEGETDDSDAFVS